MGMRRFAILLCLCLVATGCSRMVQVDVVPVEAAPADMPVQTQVFAADGTPIATLRFVHRERATRAELPQALVDAVVAAEDRRFWSHDGVDLRAIARAALANRRAGRIVQGGSTITQQLVKNRYFPDGEDTLERKAQEAQLALALEESHTKDEILTDYLNTVYFGAGAYGVRAAAEVYFGQDVTELDLAQAALLAGLLRSPESASPFNHPEAALDERARVLETLAAEGLVTRAEAEAAATTPLGVHDRPPPPATRYPYFVEHVRRTLLADPAFGPDETTRVRRLYGGGLRIHTTIDPRLQADAEAAARAFLPDPTDPEVAIAVVRPSDGHLVAAVGGRDFAARQFDLATQARRQPGSTFKVFALVAALRDGMRLEDRVEGGSGNLRLVGGEQWRVRSGTAGLITLRDAIVRSSNGAFARLGLSLGPERVAEQAKHMGVTSDVGTNPALVLGGMDRGVSPLDMAAAYATLANRGVHVPTTAVTHVTDEHGVVVWRAPSEPVAAMDGETAWYATQALRAAIEEGTGRAARLDRPAAGKTGTGQNYRDAWFVGYTPQLAAAVWVGFPDDNRPLIGIRGVSRVEGGTWPARIWRELMQRALAGEPAVEFPYPEHHSVTVLVDPTTGYLATPWCPLTEERTALPRELPTEYCPVHGPPEPEPQTPEPAPDEAPEPAPDEAPEEAPDEAPEEAPPEQPSETGEPPPA
jgi:membrane peptidoglycan carboxypeptidase